MPAETAPAIDGARARMRRFLERDNVRNAILAVIVLNAITLGLGTSQRISAQFGGLLETIDAIVVMIFVIEISAKMIAYGMGFFRSAWNIFDLVIVMISMAPRTPDLTALRALRVLRVTRLLSAVPQMRAVVQALFDALPGMGSVVVMLMIVYYVFAVIATILFGKEFPQWFGTLGESLYSLFQIMTLESWSMGIVRPVMEKFPNAWVLFIPFIMCTTFAVLNLFVGLLVNTMQAAVEAEAEAELDKMRVVLQEENAALSTQIAALHDEIRAIRAERGGGAP
ncbi:ion transporter [Limibaculum sp. FT325]|uniref:ion transporter n=1 Tax=Thermohalobaculum sediminis TaxID=2939436 RepID=UPI0020BE1D15|nr:ion transporter [Limibaculum sediminis]MCL5777306.1 ion transporter [Limibaculum sediminis]